MCGISQNIYDLLPVDSRPPNNQFDLPSQKELLKLSAKVHEGARRKKTNA